MSNEFDVYMGNRWRRYNSTLNASSTGAPAQDVMPKEVEADIRKMGMLELQAYNDAVSLEQAMNSDGYFSVPPNWMQQAAAMILFLSAASFALPLR